MRESLECVTLVEIGTDPVNNRKLLEFRVFGLSGFEKVRITGVFCPTVVAPFGGVTDVTVGGVLSAPVVVVNDELNPVARCRRNPPCWRCSPRKRRLTSWVRTEGSG